MQPKEIKRVSPRIDANHHQWFADRWGTTNAGAEFVLEAFPHLYQRALAEIRGRLSRPELSMVLDCLNGTFQTPGLSGQHVTANVEDSFSLYPGQYQKKWGVDAAALCGKLRALTSFQLAALEIWAGQFWQSPRLNDENFLEEHTASLL